MRFPWSGADGPSRLMPHPPEESTAPTAQKCAALVKALERLERLDRPQILDLGPFCGDTAIHLADRGAKVSVAEFEPPPPPPAVDLDAPDEAFEIEPLKLDFDDGRFDLIFVWELIDFIPRARLDEFGVELHRVLANGGWALVFSQSGQTDKAAARRPPRYRIVEGGKLTRELLSASPLPRYGHPTREIERALSPLTIQGIHLQRNQMREFLLVRRDA